MTTEHDQRIEAAAIVLRGFVNGNSDEKYTEAVERIIDAYNAPLPEPEPTLRGRLIRCLSDFDTCGVDHSADYADTADEILEILCDSGMAERIAAHNVTPPFAKECVADALQLPVERIKS